MCIGTDLGTVFNHHAHAGSVVTSGSEKSIHPAAALCGVRQRLWLCARPITIHLVLAVNCYSGHVRECNGETMEGFYGVSAIQRRCVKARTTLNFATRELRLIARKPMTWMRSTAIVRSRSNKDESRWMIMIKLSQINGKLHRKFIISSITVVKINCRIIVFFYAMFVRNLNLFSTKFL